MMQGSDENDEKGDVNGDILYCCIYIIPYIFILTTTIVGSFLLDYDLSSENDKIIFQATTVAFMTAKIEERGDIAAKLAAVAAYTPFILRVTDILQ